MLAMQMVQNVLVQGMGMVRMEVRVAEGGSLCLPTGDREDPQQQI